MNFLPTAAQTRRAFLGRVSQGVGAVALASLPINLLIFRQFPRAVGQGAKLNRYVTSRLVRVGTFTGLGTWNSGVSYDITDYRQFYAAPYFT